MADRTTAEALRLAKAHLEKLGWKYTPEDIGTIARVIIDAVKAEPPK